MAKDESNVRTAKTPSLWWPIFCILRGDRFTACPKSTHTLVRPAPHP